LPDLIDDNYRANENLCGIAAFAHRPADIRSSCVLILPSTGTTTDDLLACREIGAPVVFVASDRQWQLWKQTDAEPLLVQSIPTEHLDSFFERRSSDFAPSAIFRAKTWLRAGVGRQLDFVDIGLLPMIEREAGKRLVGLFEEMVDMTVRLVGWKKIPETNAEAHWLTQTNFWLLAAKLLHDKQVERFVRLDLQNIEEVFDRVARHYNKRSPKPPPLRGRREALRQVAEVVERWPSFRAMSAETLGALYEEALIEPDIRKLLGTHRTPTYLVDYMLAKLSPWIEELGAENCRIFEPACGHAPFLCGALRLLNDLLPASIAKDEDRRHDFLRRRVNGCDRDAFALEIARLSLTLADVPHSNGWGLEVGDMFKAGQLTNGIRAASVVLANPPFEAEQSAKFLRRAVSALQPGTIFGFVLPVTDLTGSASQSAREELLSTCDIREISVFPDKMFRFASSETAIILGRKQQRASRQMVQFRRIREPMMDDFRLRYTASWEGEFTIPWFRRENAGRFVIPELDALWQFCSRLPRMQEFVDVGQGFIHRSENDPRFPKGSIRRSDKRVEGFKQGFTNVEDSPDTHLLPRTTWLNLAKAVIRRPVAGLIIGTSQLVMNYAPVARHPWRIKAFIDTIGLAVSGRFLVMRLSKEPSNLSLECLWALSNSPLANAYVFAFGTKRDITSGLIRNMPVPDFRTCETGQLHDAAVQYLKAARELAPTSGVNRARAISRSGQMPLFAEETNEAQIASREYLRALHWRVDAEVLRLYSLPPAIEQTLLGLFYDVPRAGVPFEQRRYIPHGCDVQTLDDFLRITDEWIQCEERRTELIDKKFDVALTGPEQRELTELKRLFTLRRKVLMPFPSGAVKQLEERLRSPASL